MSLKGIPDVGGEDVDDKTELKKAEDDLAESLFHEREASYRYSSRSIAYVIYS